MQKITKICMNWHSLANNFPRVTHKLSAATRTSPFHHRTRQCHSERGSCKKLDDIIESRRNEARRSIVVQVYSENSYPELHSYCSQFGQIREAHHYTLTQYGENLNYIVLEFSDVESAQAAVQSCGFARDAQVLPVQSSFLYFGKGTPIEPTQGAKLTSINATTVANNDELHGWLQVAASIDDQLKILCNATKLNDLGTRMRFLAAQQIENSLTGMFPHARVLPFGSSINGFGKMGCDLDLILELDEANHSNVSSRLIFHSKELTDARYQIQKCMEKIGDVVELFLPGISNVRRILRARVPIIKYKHEFLNLEVDLSMTNTSGLYMSELLYLYGELDERVRPLVFAIRRWAHTVSLTNSVAGRWITNFSLTALVVFFLQQLRKPILPPINYLVSRARPQDTRITIDGINCTFARDLHVIDFKRTNEDCLGSLLVQFFDFYSHFDFANRALNLNEAKNTLKPDFSPMYIVNPFEISLNVSKNVSLEEVERFRMEVREAAWLLESFEERTTVAPWGLLSLLLKGPASVPRKPMLDVRKLFDEMDEIVAEKTEEETTRR